MLRGTQASLKLGRPMTESLLVWTALCLQHMWTLSSDVCGQGLAHSQKWLPRAGPKKCACSYTGFRYAFGLSFLPCFPSSKKHFCFFFSLQPHPDIFCGFLMPYNVGFVRTDSSPPLHCSSSSLLFPGTRVQAGCRGWQPCASFLWGSRQRKQRFGKEQLGSLAWGCETPRPQLLPREPKHRSAGRRTGTLSMQRSLAKGVVSL